MTLDRKIRCSRIKKVVIVLLLLWVWLPLLLLLLLLLSLVIFITPFYSCFFPILFWKSIFLSRGSFETSLSTLPRSAYIPPSPDHTCGITLGTSLLLTHHKYQIKLDTCMMTELLNHLEPLPTNIGQVKIYIHNIRIQYVVTTCLSFSFPVMHSEFL